MTRTAPGSPCPRVPCTGMITATGFCGTCRRRPPAAATAPAAPGPRPAPGAGTGRPAAPRSPAPLDRDGLVQLPAVASPSDEQAVRPTAKRPEGGRSCGTPECPGVIGIPYGDEPPPDKGFCLICGSPYDLRPQLGPGDVVAGQYEVLGYLAPGGTGWVYLAKDLELPDQRVVLKSLLNTQDAAARRKAVEERRSLTTLHHRDLVRIIGSKRHPADGEAEPADYIVMEYVAGRPLDQLLAASDEELADLFGEPFALDHVVTYGCKILGALEYLHEQGLLYCDMKPENVIHYDREIKIIDLGAVRRTDDRTSALVYTPWYAPQRREREERGFAVDSDLFTVGRTLEALARRAAPPAGLAARSFERLIGRATHDEPAARFTSAGQMSRQLWEVLREHRALGRGERYPERSTRFEPTAALFGAALGTVPPLTHWTDRPAGGPPPDLAVGPPDPQETARCLPGPIADRDDPTHTLLGQLAGDAPARTAERVRQDPGLRTVESALWLSRSYALHSEPGPAGEPARRAAEEWLAEAVRLMGPDVAGYDWRPPWHRGLLHLMRGQVREAEGEFAAVYATVPGEWAPKLALGYCAEHLRGRPAQPSPGPEAAQEHAAAREAEARAEEESAAYYTAVWERDRSQTSAAFGLARLRLRHGDRAGAVGFLDQVPTTSRHYDAARIAAIRVLTGRVAGAAPGRGDLLLAVDRLAGLPRDDAWERLLAEIRENVLAGRPAPERPPLWRYALGRRPARPDFPALPAGPAFEGAASLRALCALLEKSLRALVAQAPPALRAELLDRAYAVRPESWV
ncbi:protein kinase [Streptomyces sp. PRB2-1]|uniref:non-specific serine/threonine protein kinase n=2 Tax=Actinacidiphila epipremni TaxID=2053013 RepID=A0ABX0ZEV3_9ACTN|nr:protein kinase [Actinacidiphila epipremni]